jgi:hypothetical protein
LHRAPGRSSANVSARLALTYANGTSRQVQASSHHVLHLYVSEEAFSGSGWDSSSSFESGSELKLGLAAAGSSATLHSWWVAGAGWWAWGW